MNNQLKLEHRLFIEFSLARQKRKSYRKIAESLDCSHSTVIREIKRNSKDGEYIAIEAHQLAKARKIVSASNTRKDKASFSPFKRWYELHTNRNLLRWNSDNNEYFRLIGLRPWVNHALYQNSNKKSEKKSVKVRRRRFLKEWASRKFPFRFYAIRLDRKEYTEMMYSWAIALLQKKGELTTKIKFNFKSSWSALTKSYQFNEEERKLIAFFMPKILQVCLNNTKY